MGVDDLKKRQEQQEEKDKKFSDASPQSELVNQMKKLESVERTTGSSGAVPLTPKAKLLDAAEAESMHPGKRLRWVNVQNVEKTQLRQSEGYERLPVAEGGRQVGNLALFALPRQEYDRRVADVARRNNERLSAHKNEVENMAESVARALRDNHGIRVDAERIIIRE